MKQDYNWQINIYFLNNIKYFTVGEKYVWFNNIIIVDRFEKESFLKDRNQDLFYI